MTADIGNSAILPCRRIMIFIDGGYLRNGLKVLFRDENVDKKIDYGKLREYLVRVVASQGTRPELIRAYYYDGIVDPRDDPEGYEEQDAYFDRIRSKKQYEIRLGRLIETEKGFRQKGVDILIAVDMLSKGYLRHYDIAAFLGGDDDFVDLITAVKNSAGRRVYGFYFSHNISRRLANCFDVESKLTRQKLLQIIKRTPRKR